MLPSFHQKDQDKEKKEEEDKSNLIKKVLLDFGVKGSVKSRKVGAHITTYFFEPQAGIRLSKIIGLSSELSLALEVDSVVIKPKSQNKVIGVEVPNRFRKKVLMANATEEIFNNANFFLPTIFGEVSSGKILIEDLKDLPHLLIAGATGSGKSVYLNCLICGLIAQSAYTDIRFILIDPKMLEFSIYSGMRQLLRPIITHYNEAIDALLWAVDEMERRYEVMSKKNAKNILEYNVLAKNCKDLNKINPIVIVFDELADFILVKPNEIE